jgi:hypothetical protein
VTVCAQQLIGQQWFAEFLDLAGMETIGHCALGEPAIASSREAVRRGVGESLLTLLLLWRQFSAPEHAHSKDHDVRGQLLLGVSIKLVRSHCGGGQTDIFRDIEFHGYASSVRMGSRELLRAKAPTDEIGIGLVVGDWTELAVPLDHVRVADGLTMFMIDGWFVTREQSGSRRPSKDIAVSPLRTRRFLAK